MVGGGGFSFDLLDDLHKAETVEHEEDEIHNETHPLAHGIILVTPDSKHILEVEVDINHEEGGPETELFSIFPHSKHTKHDDASESVTNHDNPLIKERVQCIRVFSDGFPSSSGYNNGIHGAYRVVVSSDLREPSLVGPSVVMVESGLEDTILRPEPVHKAHREKDEHLDSGDDFGHHWGLMVGFALHEFFTSGVGDVPDLREGETGEDQSDIHHKLS